MIEKTINSNKLSNKVLFGYAMGDFGSTLPTVILMFWVMNYLTDVVGISAAIAGIIIMGGRVADAISDPMVGFFSDNTRSKWGRRRPWMAVAAVLLVIFTALLFINPVWITNDLAKYIWVGTAYILINLAYTMHAIPYGSLTAELTKDYNERTRLNMYRMIAANISIIIGVSGFILIVKKLTEIFDSRNIGWGLTGLLMGLIMFVGIAVVVSLVKEKSTKEVKKQTFKKADFKSYLSIFKNRPFNIVIGTFFLQMGALTTSSSVLIYFFTYVHHQPQAISVAFLCKIAISILCMPLWNMVFSRIGKKAGYIVGLSLWGVAIIVFFFVGHLIPITWVYVLFATQGIGQAVMLIGPWSLLPDTIEYDYLQTGKRREGIFYSMMYLAQKMGQATVAVMTGFILTYFGYVAGVEQSESSLYGIRLLIGPIPALIALAGIILMSFYPLTKKKYEEIIAAIYLKENQ